MKVTVGDAIRNEIEKKVIIEENRSDNPDGSKNRIEFSDPKDRENYIDEVAQRAIKKAKQLSANIYFPNKINIFSRIQMFCLLFSSTNFFRIVISQKEKSVKQFDFREENIMESDPENPGKIRKKLKTNKAGFLILDSKRVTAAKKNGVPMERIRSKERDYGIPIKKLNENARQIIKLYHCPFFKDLECYVDLKKINGETTSDKSIIFPLSNLLNTTIKYNKKTNEFSEITTDENPSLERTEFYERIKGKIRRNPKKPTINKGESTKGEKIAKEYYQNYNWKERMKDCIRDAVKSAWEYEAKILKKEDIYSVNWDKTLKQSFFMREDLGAISEEELNSGAFDFFRKKVTKIINKEKAKSSFYQMNLNKFVLYLEQETGTVITPAFWPLPNAYPLNISPLQSNTDPSVFWNEYNKKVNKDDREETNKARAKQENILPTTKKVLSNINAELLVLKLEVQRARNLLPLSEPAIKVIGIHKQPEKNPNQLIMLAEEIKERLRIRSVLHIKLKKDRRKIRKKLK